MKHTAKGIPYKAHAVTVGMRCVQNLKKYDFFSTMERYVSTTTVSQTFVPIERLGLDIVTKRYKANFIKVNFSNIR